MFCNSWLARLPVQEMVGCASESTLFGLVSWGVPGMLEVNKCAAEIRFCTKSCCLFQRYNKIENKDFLPAFKKSIEVGEAEIKAIVESTEKPTFENTIEEMERMDIIFIFKLVNFFVELD